MPIILDGRTNGFFSLPFYKVDNTGDWREENIVLNNLSSVRSWHKYFNVYSSCGVVVEG